MKLNKITALVKKSKKFKIYSDTIRQAQWICVDDAAIYPLYGFPHIREDSEILSVLGIAEDTFEDWEVEFIDRMPMHFDFSDMQGADVNLSHVTPDISDENGSIHWVCQAGEDGETLFVKQKYILPVISDEYFRMVARADHHWRRVYIAVFDGMSISAVILPTLAGKTIIDRLLRFVNAADRSMFDDSVQRVFNPESLNRVSEVKTVRIDEDESEEAER